jgi:1-acyl-sn-glycerol-3-phosphate acyltransferase
MKKTILFLRSALFTILFYLWALVVPLLIVWIVLFPKPVLYAGIRWWQRGVAWLERNVLGLSYEVIGLENVPEGACIIAAKHESASEACKPHILFGDPAVVVKEELTYIPIWGWYATASGMIPIDRGAGGSSLIKMMAAAEKAKAEGRKIVLFPQGTRVLPGVHKPYKVGVAALYQKLKVPVVPMALNSGLFWPKGRFIKTPGKMTFKILPPIPAGLPRAEMMRKLEAVLEAESDKLAGIEK